MIKVPFIDLPLQYSYLKDEIEDATKSVLESGHYILGNQVTALENEVAKYLGAKFAIGVASGTDALMLALKAVGVEAGDEVIVPTFTFFATTEAVLHLNATPVFVDTDFTTYGLSLTDVEKKLTAKTKAIIPVHLYGHPVDVPALRKLLCGRQVHIIEDCAQAFGAENGSAKVGTQGDTGCFSFFPTKILGAYGDGGMVVTSDPLLAERIRMLRTHGWKEKYNPLMIGFNSRLDELQAAFLRVKLKKVDEWIGKRRRIAQKYREVLSDHQDIRVPANPTKMKHVYNLFTVRLKSRDFKKRVLTELGIAAGIYYPIPNHLCTACSALGYQKGDFPVAENICREILSLPIYPEMNDDMIEAVATALSMATNMES